MTARTRTVIVAACAAATMLATASAAVAQQDSREGGLGALLDRFRMSDGEAREEVRRKILNLKPKAAELARAVREDLTFPASPTGVRKVAVPGAKLPVDVFIPEQYDPKKKWPVLVGLHGTGGNGSQMMTPGVPECRRLGWILVCPSLPDGDIQSAMRKAATTGFGWGDHKDNLALLSLAWVFRHYNCDTDRAYLMGVSQGGYGAWGIGTCYAFRWAAVLPYAGGIDFRENFGAAMGLLGKMPAGGRIPPGFLPPGLANKLPQGAGQLAGGGRRRDLLKNTMNTPVYFVHGSKDTIVEPAGDRKSNHELTKIGYRNHKYVEKPGWGHVPRDPKEIKKLVRDLVNWASKKTRPTNPKRIFHFSPRLDTGEAYYLRMDSFREGAHLSATRGGQRISIKTQGVKKLTVHLGKGVVKLDRPVSITVNGRTAWSKKAPLSPRIVLENYENGWDPLRAYPGRVTITVP